MSLQGLLPALRRVPAYGGLLDAARESARPRAVLPDAAKPYLAAALWSDLRRPVLLLCPRPEDARAWADHLEVYCGAGAPIRHFPESDALPYERIALDPSTLHQRISALGALRDGAAERPPLIVASALALMQKTLSPDLLARLTETLRPGDRFAVGTALERWTRMGYEVVPSVEAPGQVARRGGVVDVYSPGMELPARLDLWGDRIDSIRRFDPATQRSAAPADAVRVLPAWEALPAFAEEERLAETLRSLDYAAMRTAERDRVQDDLAQLMAGLSTDSASFFAGLFQHDTLLDHLAALSGGSAPLVVIDEPGEVAEAASHWEAGASQQRLDKQERGELPAGFPLSYAEWPALSARLERLPALELTRYHGAEAGGAVALPFDAPPSFRGSLDGLAEALGARGASPAAIATQHSQRVYEVLRDTGVVARESREAAEPPSAGRVEVVHAPAPGGWRLRESVDDGAPVLLTLLSDADLFGAVKRRPARPRRSPAPSHSLLVEELSPGQLVVHVDHGVARFAGTRPMENGGAGREYLVLEYAEGDRLYVPMEHLDRVSLYAGGSDSPPSLTRLGTQEWSRAVSRARESTRRLAVDLLAIHARREVVQGHAYPPDSPWQREMEDAFPYTETPDQHAAILDVKEDMEAHKPMDRLVCGDVGYGKTEVALRAAFKTVMDGKQVAVLVPTTILAQQHYDTFSERLEPYPIRVELLSRFRTHAEQEQVVTALKRGAVDVVIGTHRLIQKDVGFQDLGLVVVDEEHRFGVNHKERLKEMRSEVDLLTMTATPIPRTLHMALAGVRDVSNIESAPEERLPIKTYLAETSDDLVRDAIRRELERGGQVYYLHNRVNTIDMAAARVADLVPEARVIVGHGQMHEERLADAMERFGGGEADVLVCTTIIESGLDIPTVNTLIVDRADRFGLAQLYQLRGRIGRRDRRGYAYLLVQPGRRLTETAQRRLQTVAAATELGAGFRIAMRDLEIRGAGNILGAEQSGH
ncbi:MAG: transcription-repair coupling factor, partial [Chloroflexota bacterium]|nr:transcription-repair coupling factor [Chloroflexota bacterium]